MDYVSAAADFLGFEAKEIRFLIASTATVLLYYGVFYALFTWKSASRERALTVAFMLWFVTSFIVQKCWAFESGDDAEMLVELISFSAKNLVLYGITCMLVPLCERALEITSPKAVVVVTTALFVPDYVLSNWLVFPG